MIDALIGVVVAAIRSVVGVPLAIITAAVVAIEALFGENFVTEGMRNALADIDGWLNGTIEDSLRAGIRGVIAAGAEAADFPVDPDDPFSCESLTGAVNHKLDLEIANVCDPDSIREALENKAAVLVSEFIGIEGAFSTGEDLKSPERWALVVAQMIEEGVEGAGMLREHVCEPVELVLDRFCKVEECHPCMGPARYDECLRRREAERRRGRERRCKRVA